MSGKKSLVIRTSKELAAYQSNSDSKFVRQGLDALASQIRKTRHYYRTGKKEDVGTAAVTEDVMQQYLSSSPECSELFPFIVSTDEAYCNFDTIGSISEILAFCLDPSFKVHRPTHSIKTAQRLFREGDRFLVHCVSSENLVNVHSGLRLCLALSKHSSGIAAEFCRVFPFKLQFFTNIPLKPLCPLAQKDKMARNEANARKLMPPKDSVREHHNGQGKDPLGMYFKLNRAIFIEMYLALLQWRDAHIVKELAKEPTFFLLKPITHIFYDSVESSKLYFKTLLTDFVQNPHVTTKMLAHCFSANVLEEIFTASAVSLIHKKHIQHFIKFFLLRLLDVHDEDVLDGDGGDLENIFSDVSNTSSEKTSSRENLLFRIISRLRPHEDLGHLKLLTVVFAHSPQLLPKYMKQMTHHFDARKNYRLITRHGLFCKLLDMLRTNSVDKGHVQLALPNTYYKQVMQTSFSRPLPMVHIFSANTIGNVQRTYSYPVWGNSDKTVYSVQLFHKVQIKRTIPEIDVLGKQLMSRDPSVPSEELVMLHILQTLALINSAAPELLHQGMASVNRLMNSKMRTYSYALQDAFLRLCVLQGLDGQVRLSGLVQPQNGKYIEHLENVCDSADVVGPISTFGHALHLCLQESGKDFAKMSKLGLYCATRPKEEVQYTANANKQAKHHLALLLAHGEEYQLDATTNSEALQAYSTQLLKDCSALLQHMSARTCDFVEIVLVYSVSYGRSKYHYFFTDAALSEDLQDLYVSPIVLSLLMVAKEAFKGRQRGHIALFVAAVLRQIMLTHGNKDGMTKFFRQVFSKENPLEFAQSWMTKDASFCSFLRTLGVATQNDEDILQVFAPAKDMNDEDEDEDEDVREDMSALLETQSSPVMRNNLISSALLSQENIFEWKTLKTEAVKYKNGSSHVNSAINTFLMQLPLALLVTWMDRIDPVWDACQYTWTLTSIDSQLDCVPVLFNRDCCMHALLRFLHLRAPELYKDTAVYSSEEPDHPLFTIINSILDVLPIQVENSRARYVLSEVSAFVHGLDVAKLPLHHQRGLHTVQVQLRRVAHTLFTALIANNTVITDDIAALLEHTKSYLCIEQVTSVVKDVLRSASLASESLRLVELIGDQVDYSAISEIEERVVVLAAEKDQLNLLSKVLPRVSTEFLSVETKQLLTSLFERVCDKHVLGFICPLLGPEQRILVLKNMLNYLGKLSQVQCDRALTVLEMSEEESVQALFVSLLPQVGKALFEGEFHKDDSSVLLLQQMHRKLHNNSLYNEAVREFVVTTFYSTKKKTFELEQKNLSQLLFLLVRENNNSLALFSVFLLQTVVTASHVLKDGLETFPLLHDMLQLAGDLKSDIVSLKDMQELTVLYLHTDNVAIIEQYVENMKVKEQLVRKNKVNHDAVYSFIANSLLKRLNVMVMRGVQLSAPATLLPVLLDLVTKLVLSFYCRKSLDKESLVGRDTEVDCKLDDCLLANLADLFTFAVSSEQLYTCLAPFIDLIETNEASMDVCVSKFIKRKSDWVESTLQFSTRQSLLALFLHILSRFNAAIVKKVEFELFTTLGRLAFATYLGTTSVLDVLKKGVCQQLHRCYGTVFNGYENEILGTEEVLPQYPHIKVYTLFPQTFTASGALWGAVGENELVSWYILSKEKSLRHLEVLRNIDGLLKGRSADSLRYNFNSLIMSRGPPSLDQAHHVVMDPQSKQAWYDPGFVLPCIIEYVNNIADFNWLNCVKSGYVSYCIQCLDSDYVNYHEMAKHVLMRVYGYILHVERRRRFIFERKANHVRMNNTEDQQYLLEEELQMEEQTNARKDVEDDYWNMVFDDNTMQMYNQFKRALPSQLDIADKKEFLGVWTPGMRLLTYILIKLKQFEGLARSDLAFVAKAVMALGDEKDAMVGMLPYVAAARLGDKAPFLWKHARKTGLGLYQSILNTVEKKTDLEKVLVVLNELLQSVQLDSRHMALGLEVLSKLANVLQDNARKQSVIVHLCQLLQELGDRRFGYAKLDNDRSALLRCLRIYLSLSSPTTHKMVLSIVPEAGESRSIKRTRMLDVINTRAAKKIKK